MSSLFLAGEDALCCELGWRLVQARLPHWTLVVPPFNTGGISKLWPRLPDYAQQARNVRPVLCVADTDGQCPIKLLTSKRPVGAPASLLIRLAVPEADAWVMADRKGFADTFGVPLAKVPEWPDDVGNAKEQLLTLLGRYAKRSIRDDMVSITNPKKQGTGYNLRLCSFVKTGWSVDRALAHSPSLKRAAHAVERLGNVQHK
jgi:hypothetical protein